MDDKEHLARIIKAWEMLFSRDDDETIGIASEMLGLEGYCLHRLRDAVRGKKAGGYADIDGLHKVKV